MKRIFLLAVTLILAAAASAQRKQIDSLKLFISKAPDDSTKVKALFTLSQQYKFFSADSAIITIQRAYTLAVTTKTITYQRRSLILLANIYTEIGNYTKAMQLYYNVLQKAQDQHDYYQVIQTHNNIGSNYVRMEDFPKALQYLRMAKAEHAAYLATHNNVPAKFHSINIYILNNLSEVFLGTNKLDSAAYYLKEGVKYQEQDHFYILKAAFIGDMGSLEIKKGNNAAALTYYREAMKVVLAENDRANLAIGYFAFADLYNKMNRPDSAIYYAEKALSAAKEGKYLPDIATVSKLLYELYDRQHNVPLAYKYYKIATQTNDSLNSKDKVRELASLDFENKQRQLDLIAAKAAFENTVRSYILIAGFAVVVLLAFIFWRNGQQRKKANSLLHEQKEEIETTLDLLKATQKQLIQSEKMASLGELTAGIAHEIQNPLNFVNNFSEVNREMLEELKAESEKPEAERDEQLETELINDLIENEGKINHHGKRADSIVKGMLEHSRIGTGEKQPTDVNALADEFLKLSYHGLQAKDKSFNAELITHFDGNLPKINLVQQDIGRVFLNLFNNAFYAVSQKQKVVGHEYKPEVSVTTLVANGHIIISVKDNGIGIPDAIKEKIMQPFFTTKPTGEGTGLGLSLSYDIVVKGHGGIVDVDSKAGEFTEFTITLPS